MPEFENKVALIAGAAGGIGAASARALHRRGASVALADLDAVAGQALAGELGERALFQATDVCDDGQLAALVQAAVARFGGIDILVNAVADFTDGGLDASRDNWLKSYNTNVVSLAKLTELAVPHMKARGGGAVVNFSSIASNFGQRGRGPYPVTKGAIEQLTRNQAMHYSRDHIRVNAVSPSWTWNTNPFAKLADKAKADAYAFDYHPLGRFGEAEDIAEAVVFLCSRGARHITGVDLPVDGGYTMTGPDQGSPVQGGLFED
jgi:NAD(P)-dependent dehydrogenase (short-subunit alcohol dehydrogenase family)